jgi:hypothetical protein
LVTPIVVNAIKAHPFRALAHICEEVGKSVTPKPALADDDSASAVIREGFT